MIEAMVILIGRQSCQNSLLAQSIHEYTQCVCTLVHAADLSGDLIPPGALIIEDIAELPTQAVTARLEELSNLAAANPIAVLNADERLPLEPIVAWPGIRGVFFRGTAPETLQKGIAALLKGDYWLPRKALSDHLEQTRSRCSHARAGGEERLLTRKEAQIISLLANGNNNIDIAGKLNVSPHTVKTHIYNLFRKIGVNTRAQASVWCLNNIGSVEHSNAASGGRQGGRRLAQGSVPTDGSRQIVEVQI
jgi:LuxR family transcriptional regulator of csgAB operon